MAVNVVVITMVVIEISQQPETTGRWIPCIRQAPHTIETFDIPDHLLPVVHMAVLGMHETMIDTLNIHLVDDYESRKLNSFVVDHQYLIRFACRRCRIKVN